MSDGKNVSWHKSQISKVSGFIVFVLRNNNPQLYRNYCPHKIHTARKGKREAKLWFRLSSCRGLIIWEMFFSSLYVRAGSHDLQLLEYYFLAQMVMISNLIKVIHFQFTQFSIFDYKRQKFQGQVALYFPCIWTWNLISSSGTVKFFSKLGKCFVKKLGKVYTNVWQVILLSQ